MTDLHCCTTETGLPWWLRGYSVRLQCGRPRSGRSPGEGSGNPLQYSCLENPMDGGAWEAAVHRVTKSRTQLSDFTFFHSRNQHDTIKQFFSN